MTKEKDNGLCRDPSVDKALALEFAHDVALEELRGDEGVDAFKVDAYVLKVMHGAVNADQIWFMLIVCA